LNAFERRFFRTCPRRCGSETIEVGSLGSIATVNARPFSSPTCRNARSASSARVENATGARSSSILPASTFDRSRMSLMRERRSLPAEWIVRANSTSRSASPPSSLSASSRDRISIEFSGVRSSWDMFARNSDLYFEDSASCAAFSSNPRRANSISSFLISISRFCADSNGAFSSSSSLVSRNSSDCFSNSWVSVWDCVSKAAVLR